MLVLDFSCFISTVVLITPTLCGLMQITTWEIPLSRFLDYLNIVNWELKMLQLKTIQVFIFIKEIDFGKFILPSLHHFRSQNSFIGHSLAQLRPVLKKNHKLLWKCCWWGVTWIIPVNKPKENVSEFTLQPDRISSLQTWRCLKAMLRKEMFLVCI